MRYAAPVIIDIVGSRNLADRKGMQKQIHAIFSRVDEAIAPRRELWATVGDEFQVVYASASEAVRATAIARLLCTQEADLRFGIGYGEVRTVARGEFGPIEDGSGWYRARLALQEVERMQAHGYPWLRTWATFGEEQGSEQSLTRTHLTTRDHIISRMKAKEKRIAASWLSGVSQREIARAEKISQSAVSQKLDISGGASLAHSYHILLGDEE